MVINSLHLIPLCSPVFFPSLHFISCTIQQDNTVSVAKFQPHLEAPGTVTQSPLPSPRMSGDYSVRLMAGGQSKMYWEEIAT